MIVGLKFFPDSIDVARKLQHDADYFEIMAKRSERKIIESFQGLNAPVMVFHTEHMLFGVNAADRKKREHNMEAVRFAQEMADQFGSRFIIVHPGIKGDMYSMDNIIDFFKDLDDKRIITENMPYIGDFKGLDLETFGRLPEEMRIITKSAGIGFCLDFEHMWAASFGYNMDPVELAREFIGMRPAMYHMADSIMGRNTDSHLNIGDGDADIRLYKSMIPDTAMISLETHPDPKKMLNDLKFMEGS